MYFGQLWVRRCLFLVEKSTAFKYYGAVKFGKTAKHSFYPEAIHSFYERTFKCRIAILFDFAQILMRILDMYTCMSPKRATLVQQMRGHALHTLTA